jgi:VWFA-related protein
MVKSAVQIAVVSAIATIETWSRSKGARLRHYARTLFTSALGLGFAACACAQPTLPAEGRLKLDVVVSDPSGAPVTGLDRSNFTLLDNNHPANILSFHAFDRTAEGPAPPLELILVIDEAQHTYQQIQDEELGLASFLKQNGGHLALPTTIYRLSDLNLSVTAQPTTDGNALAALILSKNGMREVEMGEFECAAGGHLSTYSPSYDSRMIHCRPAALVALGSITLTERRKPARKLVVWVGNLGPIARQNSFEWVTEFSTRLREARITLSSVSFWQTPAERLPYLRYLDGVKSAKSATINNLAMDVLAAQSGGQVLAPEDSNLAQLIQDCVRNPDSFYTLSFEPEPTDQPDDYHRLSIEINKPGLAAHTNTGYYDEPVYFDQPYVPPTRLKVAELELELAKLERNSDKDAAHKLSSMALAERWNTAALLSWKRRLPGAKSWAALVSVADAAAFLPPPGSLVLNDAPPDSAARQRMLSSTIDYLLHAIPRLPDFFANRTTVHYREPEIQAGQSWKTAIADRTLNPTGVSRATVLYRNGYEVLDFGNTIRELPEPYLGNLSTSGTFGPILSSIMMDIAGSDLVWNRWQQGAGGKIAVFSYKVSEPKSRYQVASSAILPDGNTIGEFRETNGYHGEIEIDPDNGTVLRLTVEADLAPNLPIRRAAVLVEYGPVGIGGKTCMCLQRSVTIMRFRSIFHMEDWGENFKLYGPFVTMMDDVTFNDYHMFHGEARILSGASSMLEQRHPPSDSEPIAMPPSSSANP